MSHYLVYLPGAEEPNDNLLDQVGLKRLRGGGVPIHWHGVQRHGPDGGFGMIANWCNKDDSKNTDPCRHQELEWTAAKPDKSRNLDGMRYWFGVDPNNQPVPEDLEFPRRFKGHSVRCADGNFWHIPAAARLPHSHGLNDDGEWERRVAKQYEEFYNRAMQYGVALFSEVDAFEVMAEAMPQLKDSDYAYSVQLNDTDKHCCAALMLNYRVTPEIIDFLGLLDDETMVAIIACTLDLPEIKEVLSQKKSYSPVGIPVG